VNWSLLSVVAFLWYARCRALSQTVMTNEVSEFYGW